MVRAIFFDAGGTLIFPDRSKTLAPLHALGVSVTEEQIRSAERAARRYRDANATPGSGENVDEQYWITYYRALLGEKPVEDSLISELVAASRNSANWSHVLPETRGCLLDLKSTYRLAVISNSDGRISKTFERVGLADCFETIVDSGIVGHQKPSPIIFQAALTELQVEADESVYVGDVYSIDYVGATAVGMKAVLIDPYGTYGSNGAARVESVCELGQLLARL